MHRRRFLQFGALSTAAIVAPPWSTAFASTGTRTNFHLVIDSVDAEMIDGTKVYQLRYFLDDDEPSPILRVTEGDVITIRVTNEDEQPHGFAIPGVRMTPASAIIEEDQTVEFTFTAPRGGSYLYLDPYKAPLNRIIGLHGAMVVKPLLGTTPNGSPTPYSRAEHSPQVQALFDALGVYPRFRGKKWDPNDPARQKVWVFSQHDPSLNARIEEGQMVDPASVVPNFLPRYFTINGLSGFDTSVHDGTSGGDHEAAREIMPIGREGEPCLIRSMNAGLATHAPHIHGNHVMECNRLGPDDDVICETSVFERDSWTLAPLQRKDMLLPFNRPPDIPKWPPKQEPFPLRYPMHCHNELSQTAGGGNYPQGLVTHWEMTGPTFMF